MSTVLVWREQFQKLYAKYSFYIIRILQFALGLAVFGMINSNIGFLKTASTSICTIGLAVICAFLPLGVMTLVATMLILGGLVIVGYIIVLVIYGVCASSYYKLKHNRAKQRVKRYYRDMSKLENYGKKERRS